MLHLLHKLGLSPTILLQYLVLMQGLTEFLTYFTRYASVSLIVSPRYYAGAN